MAEAHQGVAFSFSVTEDEGLHFNVSLEALRAVILSGIRSWRKILSRLANQILNGVYPSHPLRGVLFVGVVTGLKHYKKIDTSFGIVSMIQDKIPRNWMSNDRAELAATAVFAGTAWFGIVTLRRYSLQAIFSYHGWMYDERGKTSMKTKVWAVFLRLLIGTRPKLYSYQSSLPYLPVPAVKDTMDRYLRTVKPLLDADTYERVSREALDFEQGVGRRLNRYLVLKSYLTANYVSDWWEEYVYLRGRSPIMVNSNFYAVDLMSEPKTSIQAARAANCIACAFAYRRLLDNESLEPLMIQEKVPLCSRQYERQFNSTRVPGMVTDKIVHYKDSKHVAVYSKGKWFKLNTYYNSQPLNARELEIEIQKILDDDSDTTKGERYLAALTAGDRIPWAQARKKHFSKGVNRTSLYTIEKAAFVVVLDEEEYSPTPSIPMPENRINDHRQLDNLARALLHGKGYDRWFDKSFNMIITKNGRIGLNTEHTWADAPVTGHMWEYILGDEIFKIGYDEKGHSRGSARFEELPDPIRLKFEFNSKLEESIMSSLKTATELLNDVDIHVYVHNSFGKGVMKNCRVSPDAFTQMALQLAYYTDIGRFDLTYESAMTRLFREGRTETVRSCSVESCEWVRAMKDPNVSNEERVRLFRRACDYHQYQYRAAMTGAGVDRHLFCLYVVSKYLEIDTPFLKEVLSEPWRLSTSQTPSSQTNKIDTNKHPEYLSAGGGFGPVADDGYGVSYIFSGENFIAFHISCKKSCEKTDSYRFGQRIREALVTIKEMMETDKKNKHKDQKDSKSAKN